MDEKRTISLKEILRTMDSSEIKSTVVSASNYERLVIEIEAGNRLLATVSHEEATPEVTLVASEESDLVSAEPFIEALQWAVDELRGMYDK